ncbi:unnamed protein product, partial [Sphacelaria rigidula]
MSAGQDPDEVLTKIFELRDQLVYMGEPISDETLTDIVVEGLTDDYDRVKYDAERGPDLSISDIEVTLRNMYANRLARGILGNKGLRGRESAMVAALPPDSSLTSSKFKVKCYSCGKLGHHMRDCRSRIQPKSR